MRTVLQRHLPKHLEPLRGFAIDGDHSTRQVDVLIFDNTKPALFRSGDLAFVTPDAAVGVIEVKSNISDTSKLRLALEPLAENIERIRKGGNPTAFAGLFSFDTALEGPAGLRKVLECLRDVAHNIPERIVDMVAIGPNIFVLHWEGDGSPGEITSQPRRWHAYSLERMAPGYFLNNAVFLAAPQSVQANMNAWFPSSSTAALGINLSKAHIRQDPEDLGFGVIDFVKPAGR